MQGFIITLWEHSILRTSLIYKIFLRRRIVELKWGHFVWLFLLQSILKKKQPDPVPVKTMQRAFGYRWDMKYDPGNPVWETDIWVWRLIRGRNTTHFYNSIRQDFTVRESYGGIIFIFCRDHSKNSYGIYSHKVIFQQCGHAYIWLANVGSCRMTSRCIPAKAKPGSTFLWQTSALVPLLHQRSGLI